MPVAYTHARTQWKTYEQSLISSRRHTHIHTDMVDPEAPLFDQLCSLLATVSNFGKSTRTRYRERIRLAQRAADRVNRDGGLQDEADLRDGYLQWVLAHPEGTSEEVLQFCSEAMAQYFEYICVAQVGLPNLLNMVMPTTRLVW